MAVKLQEGVTDEHLALLYADPLVLRTGDDDHPATPIHHELAHYISVFADSVFVGCYLLIDFSEREREAHCFLLKRAIPYSREISNAFLCYVFSNPKVSRLTGWVREDLKEAVNHNAKHGFQIEGVKFDAVMVNGELKNLVMMGITRRNWERRT